MCVVVRQDDPESLTSAFTIAALQVLDASDPEIPTIGEIDC